MRRFLSSPVKNKNRDTKPGVQIESLKGANNERISDTSLGTNVTCRRLGALKSPERARGYSMTRTVGPQPGSPKRKVHVRSRRGEAQSVPEKMQILGGSAHESRVIQY